MTTEPLDIDAIEARANAATPGPWVETPYSRSGAGTDERYTAITGGREVVTTDQFPCSRKPADATFIAHARTDIPALVARVRELEARPCLDCRDNENAARNLGWNGLPDEHPDAHGDAVDWMRREIVGLRAQSACCVINAMMVASLEAERDELRALPPSEWEQEQEALRLSRQPAATIAMKSPHGQVLPGSR